MLPLQDTLKNASEKCGYLIQKSRYYLKNLVYSFTNNTLEYFKSCFV